MLVSGTGERAHGRAQGSGCSIGDGPVTGGDCGHQRRTAADEQQLDGVLNPVLPVDDEAQRFLYRAGARREPLVRGAQLSPPRLTSAVASATDRTRRHRGRPCQRYTASLQDMAPVGPTVILPMPAAATRREKPGASTGPSARSASVVLANLRERPPSMDR